MNLYELTQEYQILQDLLESGEIDQDCLDQISLEYEEKVDAYGRIIKNLTSNIEAIKEETKRLKEKQSTIENSLKRLKEAIYNSMLAIGERKIKTNLFTFSIQKNGGNLPVILDAGIEELPDEFVITEKKPNLKAIARYIEETGDVTQFHFGERGESLRIR